MANVSLRFVSIISCLLLATLCQGADYRVMDGKDYVGKIRMNAEFHLNNSTTVNLPSSALAVGSLKDSKMSVRLTWDNTNTFDLIFQETGEDVHLTTAMLTLTGQDPVTWSLDRDLHQSNYSFKCSYLFAVSKSSPFARLVLKSVHIQVFNFKGDFGDAVTCEEDEQAMVAGNWTLLDNDQKSCLRFQAAVAFNITYKTMGDNDYKVASVNLPPSAVVMQEQSYCATPGKDVNTTLVQQLALGFYEDWRLILRFTRDANITHDNKADHWMVDQVELNLVFNNLKFPDSKQQQRKDFKNTVSPSGEGALGLFNAPKDRSYSCAALQEKTVVENFTLITQTLQVQPFMYTEEFHPAESCTADMMVSDVVPIIIGAALAILIVVVLVAYLIGRARTRRQTYENI